MYVDIGGNICLATKTIVAVLDLDSITSGQNKRTQQFLVYAETNGKLFNISNDLPQSLVITIQEAYLSPLRSKSIIERINRPLIYSK